MIPAEYARENAAPPGSMAYYSLRCHPEPARSAVTAVHAFGRAVCAVVERCSNVDVGRAKLTWWREETLRTFAGTSQHPASNALRETAQHYGLERGPFLEMIESLEADLARRSFPEAADLLAHCRRVAGTLGHLEAQIVGHRRPETRQSLVQLQAAVHLAELLRDVRQHLAGGRHYLPDADLDRCGIDPAELRGLRTSPRMQDLFQLQGERARRHFSEALAELSDEDRRLHRRSVVLAALYQALLDEIERDGYRLLERRVALTPLRKLWIAWRTERAEPSAERAAA
jgi:phytoene synthase